MQYYFHILLGLTSTESFFIENVRAKLMKPVKQLYVPLLRNKNDDHVLLNIRRESQGCILSFKLSWVNIEHGQFTLRWNVLFDFQCKRIRNGYVKN